MGNTDNVLFLSMIAAKKQASAVSFFKCAFLLLNTCTLIMSKNINFNEKLLISDYEVFKKKG